jgi:hypothetical protein
MDQWVATEVDQQEIELEEAKSRLYISRKFPRGFSYCYYVYYGAVLYIYRYDGTQWTLKRLTSALVVDPPVTLYMGRDKVESMSDHSLMGVITWLWL